MAAMAIFAGIILMAVGGYTLGVINDMDIAGEVGDAATSAGFALSANGIALLPLSLALMVLGLGGGLIITGVLGVFGRGPLNIWKGF